VYYKDTVEEQYRKISRESKFEKYLIVLTNSAICHATKNNLACPNN